MRELAPSLLLATLLTIALALVTVWPAPGANVIVIFPQRTASDVAVAQVIGAGWRPVRQLRSNIVVAGTMPGPRSASQPEAAIGDLHRNGAVLVLDALGVRGCTTG